MPSRESAPQLGVGGVRPEHPAQVRLEAGAPAAPRRGPGLRRRCVRTRVRRALGHPAHHGPAGAVRAVDDPTAEGAHGTSRAACEPRRRTCSIRCTTVTRSATASTQSAAGQDVRDAQPVQDRSRRSATTSRSRALGDPDVAVHAQPLGPCLRVRHDERRRPGRPAPTAAVRSSPACRTTSSSPPKIARVADPVERRVEERPPRAGPARQPRHRPVDQCRRTRTR